MNNIWKYCPKCKCILPSIMFSRNRRSPDDCDDYCKECKKNFNLKWIEKIYGLDVSNLLKNKV